jgi:phosphomannomutase
MVKYIFDVDGTLTGSRDRMNKDFAVWFSKFCQHNDVYLVTGSDRPRTVEQVGEFIYHKCKRGYQCSGNDVWEGDRNIRTNDWVLPELARYFLNSCLYESKFGIRTGNHIDERPGMINFSILGRGATTEQRAAYVSADTQMNERRIIADSFNTMFPDLQANVAGDTGIDIGPKGADKAQILSDFKNTDKLLFIGDKCAAGGNDYSIANAIAARSDNKNSFAYGPGKFYNTEGWEQTWEILKNVHS